MPDDTLLLGIMAVVVGLPALATLALVVGVMRRPQPPPSGGA